MGCVQPSGRTQIVGMTATVQNLAEIANSFSAEPFGRRATCLFFSE
jgi:hypothetical protein